MQISIRETNDVKEQRYEIVRFCDEINKNGPCCTSCPVMSDCCRYTGWSKDDGDVTPLYEAIKAHLAECAVNPTTTPEKPLYDPVNSPKHYASTSVECIDMMAETQGSEAVIHFCICNAFKYLWRHNSKNGTEDIKKASWYLNKAVELMEKQEQEEREKFCPSPTRENFIKMLYKNGIKYEA